MPGKHGYRDTRDTPALYERAHRDTLMVEEKNEDQRAQIRSAYLGEQRNLLRKVTKAREERKDRWTSKTQDNPMGKNLLKDDRRNEAHSVRSENLVSGVHSKGQQKSQDLYLEFCERRVTGADLEENELARLRLERRRLLERQQQIKAALELRRRNFTGNIARTVKQEERRLLKLPGTVRWLTFEEMRQELTADGTEYTEYDLKALWMHLKVFTDSAYNSTWGHGPGGKERPIERVLARKDPLSQSLPALGSGITPELRAQAFPPRAE